MVDDLVTSQRGGNVSGFRSCRGVTGVVASRLVRFSSLLLVIALGLGCDSNRQDVPDAQAAPAVEAAGEQRGNDIAGAEWPSTDLAEFVFTRLDLTTFRNSTGPQREPGARFFSDLGIRPTKVSETTAMYDGDWLYAVSVLGRRDFNGDQLEEVAICFTDRAQNGGTYGTRKPLLLQLVGRRAVALDFEIDAPEADSCPPMQ